MKIEVRQDGKDVAVLWTDEACEPSQNAEQNDKRDRNDCAYDDEQHSQVILLKWFRKGFVAPGEFSWR